MKPITNEKSSAKKSHCEFDDENVRYKLNMEYFNKLHKISKPKVPNKSKIILHNDNSSDSEVRYKFPTVMVKPLNINSVERKPKQKSKIKVNFWSNKPTVTRLHNKDKTKRRQTVDLANQEAIKPKSSAVKVRKRVSFLPSPLFTENHIPMVTVPDDLTIQFNEEEANDLGEDLNHAFFDDTSKKPSNPSKRNTDTIPKNSKRYRNSEDSNNRQHNCDNELEFFSKYVVQKLRRMETNQRIYSENLINTVLMLGQLGKLNGKSKIGDA